jgi:predicted metal-binding membrane protein
MMWMPMPGQSWGGASVMFMLMWLAMMVAMMLPSALPMVAKYYRVTNRDAGATLLLVAAYFLIWNIAGGVIFVAGVVWANVCMHSDALSRAMPMVFGVSIVAAGIMQFMPWTALGLAHCRGPLSCGAMKNAKDASPFRLGLRCGVSCLACCSGPTLILLTLGMMNLLVIALVTLLISMEKLMPSPRLIMRLSGVAAVIAGIAMAGSMAV